ncbi:MAG: hypothetical protein K6A41_04380 [Bacteroidales bacterium]|nr:hypothetical protein [Bacteroidales bacterium]
MIRIFANGQELKLYRSTSLNVELTNALFSSPDIEGDVSYTFNLPVEGNEAVINHANLLHSDSPAAMPCSVYCNGALSWSGNIIIQKTSWDSVSAAIVINPYPDDFAGKSLTKDADEATVISASRSIHDAAWRLFLENSVNQDDVKFAPFINEDGYGSENDNWGWWYGNKRSKVVNPLYFNDNGVLIENDTVPFSQVANQLFNLDDSDGEGSAVTEDNQLAFCPQIRLSRILEMWSKNAGYRFINHLGEDINRTYLQSQRSLDGSIAQYDDIGEGLRVETNASQWISSRFLYCNSYWLDGQSQDSYVHDGMVWIQSPGWWQIDISADYTRNDVSLGQWAPDYSNVYLKIYTGNHTLAEIHDGSDIFLEQTFHNPEWHVNSSRRVYIPSTYCNVGLKFCLYIRMKHNGWVNDQYFPRILQHVSMDISFRNVSLDQQQAGFNIFRRQFSIPECCPDVTNAEFLKTIMETFGLCYFISGKMKQLELVPFSSLEKAGALDLTDYELSRETESSVPEEALHSFRLKPLTGEEYDKSLRIDDVASTLPDAYVNHEHYVLQTKTNTLFRAGNAEDEEGHWVENWEEIGGNPDSLYVGSGKETRHEPSVSIPHQRFAGGGRRGQGSMDVQTGETPQLAVANFTIHSDLYNCGEKPSEIILTQYRGFRKRTYPQSSSYPYVMSEVMLPVWADGMNLKTTGDGSVGETYIKPVLELENHRTVTYKFRIPYLMIQTVEDLLRPDTAEPEDQTRFLMVRNVKSVPKKIQFQIDNDRDDTVLCQIEAVKFYS